MTHEEGVGKDAGADGLEAGAGAGDLVKPPGEPAISFTSQDEDLYLPWWVGYDSVLAVAAFLMFNSWVSLMAAIIATTAVGIASAVLRVRLGISIGIILPVVIVAVLIRGVIGIVANNPDVYFGIGIAYKYAIALGVALTVPLKLRIADLSLRRALGLAKEVCDLPEFRKPIDRSLLALGAVLAASASFDIWLLSGDISANSYVLWRLLINWPLYVFITVVGLYALARSLSKVPGFPGLMALMEEQAKQRAEQRRRR